MKVGASPRRLLFRVDASPELGSGHLVRCLALAGELANHRIEPWFASRNAASDVAGRVERGAFPHIDLNVTAAVEVKAINDYAPSRGSRRPFTELVMDHYDLGEEWLRAARGLATRRLVVDDLADRRLPCEILVNPNLGVSRDDYSELVFPSARLLLGLRYVLLRPSFRLARVGGRRPAGEVRNVLITMGGSDPSDATAAAVRAVRSALPRVRIDVVLGALYGGSQRAASGITVHRAIGEAPMARLMMDADLAIGAGGTTSWERSALGLPSVILRVASNQDRVARELDGAGAAVDAGTVEDLETGRLSALVRQLANDRSRRQSMSDLAWGLVDARGAERVAHHIDGVRIRRASIADAKLLWSWANDPSTREASFNPEPIPYPAHLEWLADRLADRSCLLLIGTNGAGPLGQVRFERRGNEAEVSVSVATEYRGTVGGLLLEAAVRRFRKFTPGTVLIARIKDDNVPSRRMFERAGFRLQRQHGEVLLYHSALRLTRN